jgi:hypothetical protein
VSRAWETDFLAVSVAIGEPIPAVLAALGGGGVLRARGLLDGLESKVKPARAAALAMALAKVISDVEEMELREVGP